MKIKNTLLLLGLTSLCLTKVSSATDYYVDCSQSNNGTGLSVSSPWNSTSQINSHGSFTAGDKILFKKNQVCDLASGPNNAISPSGSGNVNNPITISSYDSGDKPVINQNGNSQIFNLANLSYWTIESLSLKGDGVSPSDGSARVGILVKADNADVHGITISSVSFTDIIGQDVKFGGGSAGILFYNKDELNFEFQDILIENNVLTNVHRSGIEFATAMQSEVTSANPPFTLNPAKKSKNIVVKNNTLNKIGGDGIVLDGTDGGVVEGNNLNLIANISAAHNVAIWSRNAINSLFQHNVITNSRRHPGTSDGQALDADWWGFNNIFQYNLTKDNQGGFSLLCTNRKSTMSALEQSYIPANTPRSIFRYNISINDGYNDEALFLKSGSNANSLFVNCFLKPEGIEVYNNSFYVNYGNTVKLLGPYSNQLTDSNFYNNIFYAATGTTIDMQRSNTGVLSSLADFRNNTMFGNFTDVPGHASNTTDDPLLIGPFDIASGFKPKQASPVLNTGQVIANNGGVDFEGVVIDSTPNRGAFETTATVVFELVTHSSGQQLNAVADAGSDVILASSSSSVNPDWRFVDANNGYFFIENRNDNTRLHVNTINDDVSVVSNSDSSDSVLWQTSDAGNGNVFITNKVSGKKLHAKSSEAYVVNLSDAIWTGPNVQWTRSVSQ